MGEGSEFGICEGLERAIEKFKKGEKSRIELKSKYAFKAEGKAELNIPPNADIEYEVELKNFEKVRLIYASMPVLLFDFWPRPHYQRKGRRVL